MSKKSLLFSAVFLLLIFSCSKDDAPNEQAISIPASQKDPMAAREINDAINYSLQTKARLIGAKLRAICFGARLPMAIT